MLLISNPEFLHKMMNKREFKNAAVPAAWPIVIHKVRYELQPSIESSRVTIPIAIGVC